MKVIDKKMFIIYNLGYECAFIKIFFKEKQMEKEKQTQTVKPQEEKFVKAVSKGTFITIAVFVALFGYLGSVMGIDKVFGVMFKTGFDVLINTSFYIMAVAILAGACSSIWSEFGVIALVNKLLSPLMRPLFGLPGAAAMGAVTTYVSDNPAILALAEDPGYDKYFTPAEKVTHTNFGTTFGMGLIVTTYMLGLGKEYFLATLIGNIAAILGGVISCRLVLRAAKKYYHEDRKFKVEVSDKNDPTVSMRKIRSGGTFERTFSAMMDGARSGVSLGLACAPGTVLICTLVMILTFGPSGENGQYMGVAYEGVRLLPKLAAPLLPITKVLFGFVNSEVVVFPLTALGAVGSAMGLTKGLLEAGFANAHTVAVFIGMGICWSGFFSTHIGMLNTLGHDKFIKTSIGYHIVGGLCAGVIANYLYLLVSMFV